MKELGWKKHDGSDVCPVPAGHDVEVRWRYGSVWRNEDPQNWIWGPCGPSTITHYRDWTAFEQQQASAEVRVTLEDVNYIADLCADRRGAWRSKVMRALITIQNRAAAHEPKGEVPKNCASPEVRLLTEAQLSTIRAMAATEAHADTIENTLRASNLIAPEPVDPLLIEARELIAKAQEERGNLADAGGYRMGEYDKEVATSVVLAALKRGMELERGVTLREGEGCERT